VVDLLRGDINGSGFAVEVKMRRERIENCTIVAVHGQHRF
jgi:hypothetical protein